MAEALWKVKDTILVPNSIFMSACFNNSPGCLLWGVLAFQAARVGRLFFRERPPERLEGDTDKLSVAEGEEGRSPFPEG